MKKEIEDWGDLIIEEYFGERRPQPCSEERGGRRPVFYGPGQEVLNWLHDHKTFTRSRLLRELKLTEQQADHWLRRGLELGLLERRGKVPGPNRGHPWTVFAVNLQRLLEVLEP
jgi:hypothetical protein